MAIQYPSFKSFSPKPDIQGFMDAILGRKTSPYPRMVEFIVDEPVMRSVLTTQLGRRWVNPGGDRESQKAYLDNIIEFWFRMGYDMMHYENSLNFPGAARVTENTALNSQNNRSWAEESIGAITSWEDFEKYPFPKVEEFDFFPFEYLNDHLPDGLGLAVAHGGGIFERVSWIFSIEMLCFLLFDQPDLVDAVTQKISELELGFYRQLLDLENISAIFPGDDMGFRSSTIISPSDLRKKFLPFHTSVAKMSHDRGIPYFLHSCGNLLKIMPDLIETVGIDGKHSYEDAIIPMEQFSQLFGDRIAVLGGMDINLLATSSQEQVRERVKKLVEECSKRGRYAIGSGNSIPDYVPVENYLTMVDEILSYRK